MAGINIRKGSACFNEPLLTHKRKYFMTQEKMLTNHWMDEVLSLLSFYSLSAFNKFLVVTGSIALLAIAGMSLLILVVTAFIYVSFMLKLLFF